MIIRGPRPEARYYILDKRISEKPEAVVECSRNAHLSPWQAGRLARVHSESRERNCTSGCAERSRCRVSILRELQCAGCVRRGQGKRSDSRYAEVEYIVSELPCAPLTDCPEAVPRPGLPDTEQPDTANPTLPKTDFNQVLNALNTETNHSSPAAPAKIKKGVKLEYDDHEFHAFWQA